MAGTPEADPATRPRRSWLRRLVAVTQGLVLLLVAADLGAAWYFASELLNIEHPIYPTTVLAVAGDEVTVSRDPDALRPIRYELIWPGGHVQLDASVRQTRDGVVRRMVELPAGAPVTGTHVFLDGKVFDGDPRSARGLDFSTVNLPDELGDFPAWYVPPTAAAARSTWIIAVHGRASDATETLRILPTLAATGAPTLAVSYRNDVGTPASPDGYYHLGDTEWHEVAAAVSYARAHGATGVVLYGWSLGGAIVMTALRRLPPADAALVRGAVLDGPVLDWYATLALQAAQRHLPGPLTWTGERMAEARAHLSLDDLNQLRYTSALRVPVLIFVDTDDTTVANGPSRAFAAARPDLVTLVTTSGGGHTLSWNVDPGSYERSVRDFLTAHA